MPFADQVPINSPHSTMHGGKWVVLITRSTGSALRAVCPFQPSHHAGWPARSRLRRQRDGFFVAFAFEAIADRGAVVAELVITDDRIGAELPQQRRGVVASLVITETRMGAALPQQRRAVLGIFVFAPCEALTALTTTSCAGH